MQPENRNVGIDLDGVIADIVGQLIRFSRVQYDLTLLSSQFRSEDIETCTPIKADQLKTLFSQPKFFQTMRAVHRARQTLLKLSAAGYTINIVTDRFWYPTIQDDTRKWLSDRLIPFTSLAFARKTEKQATAERIGLGWFIEDQRSNANLLSKVSRVFLIDRPYNQGLIAKQVVRVKNLAEATETILANRSTRPDDSCLSRTG